MTQEGQIPPPPVMWAQRKEAVFVTICLEDCKDPIIKIEPEMVYFKGVGGTEHKLHELTINLYDKIDPTQTIQYLRGRIIELVLAKANVGPYWPRLIKEKTKAHWLKSDFNKWKDEDDSGNEGEMESSNNGLADMMRQMGGLGGSGDKKPNLDYSDDSEDEGEAMDSDDDYLPALVD